MKNRFNLNEEEKKHIRGLHNINEQVVGYGEQGLGEDAGMDTPGGNPDYFYGDDSLDKLRKFAELSKMIWKCLKKISLMNL